MTKPNEQARPDKPYKDFPLRAHANGQWVKKIRGKLHYFGAWADPEAALEKYKQQRESLQLGRNPSLPSEPAATGLSSVNVEYLCNYFLTKRHRDVTDGKLGQRTYNDYHASAKRMAAFFGRDTLVSTLGPEAFSAYMQSWPQKWAAGRLGREVRQTQVIFRYCCTDKILAQIPHYGNSFRQPSELEMRRVRSLRRKAHGTLEFGPCAIRSMISNLPDPWPAMVALGINCGFGNTDLAELPIGFVDLDSDWIDYPRRKTGIERTCWLWPETLRALRRAAVNRPAPATSGEADLFFRTKYGNRFVRLSPANQNIDQVSSQFRKFLIEWDMHRPGLNFYSLRRTFETVASNTKDQQAVDHIMGHVDPSMAAVYRQGLWQDRIKATSDFVRNWVYGLLIFLALSCDLAYAFIRMRLRPCVPTHQLKSEGCYKSGVSMSCA